MVKKVRIVAMVSMLIFLFTALAHAGGGVTVVKPNGGQIWTSGETRIIRVKIDPDAFTTNVPVAKYSIFYRCEDILWKKITTKLCSPESNCYPYYPWVVSDVATEQNNCYVKAVAYDANGNKLASDKSDEPFTIKPFVFTGPLP